MPRSFTGETRKREFHRERRRHYLAEIGGPPTLRQAELIDLKIREEWEALRLEAEYEKQEAATGEIALELRRLAGESRRREMLHRRDFARTLQPARRPPKASPLSIAEHLRRRRVTE